MRVNHAPAFLFALLDEPRGVAIQHAVVAVEHVAVLHRIGGFQTRGNRQRVEYRRREMDDLRAGFLHLLAQLADAGLVRREARIVEREVDAAVHAVAREHKVRLHRREHAIEALMHIGAREFSARVPRLAQPAHGLARQAAINHLDVPVGELREDERIEKLRVVPRVGDAIAEEKDALHAGQEVLREGRADDGGECGEDERERAEWFHGGGIL